MIESLEMLEETPGITLDGLSVLSACTSAYVTTCQYFDV